MGLFKKVKDILFDEEEDYTSQIKITPEMRQEDITYRNEKPADTQAHKEEVVKQSEVIRKPEVHEERPVQRQNIQKETSERELFQSDSTFPFLDFDEDEFMSQKTPTPVKKEEPPAKKPNAYELEKTRRIERRVEKPTYSRTEVIETSERRKFKPSPIISPVYGVLDKDYSKDDIFNRRPSDKIDVQEVRDKAFGEKPKKLEKPEVLDIPKERPVVRHYEESETVITKPLDKEKKVKTIDELLEETSNIVVDIDRDLESEIESIMPESYEDYEPRKHKERKLEDTKEVNKVDVNDNEEDTLENDLFDLIDQMYTSKEDGE